MKILMDEKESKYHYREDSRKHNLSSEPTRCTEVAQLSRQQAVKLASRLGERCQAVVFSTKSGSNAALSLPSGWATVAEIFPRLGPPKLRGASSGACPLAQVPACYQARSGVQKKELQKSVDACQRRSQSPLLVLPSSSGIPSPRNPVRTFGSKTSGTNVELSMSDADSSTERIAGLVALVASLDLVKRQHFCTKASSTKRGKYSK